MSCYTWMLSHLNLIYTSWCRCNPFFSSNTQPTPSINIKQVFATIDTVKRDLSTATVSMNNI